MTNTTMPFQKLSEIFCPKGDTALFPNQTIMYLVLVPFSGNNLSAEFNFTTTDDLIPYIKSYLHDFYYNEPTDKYHFLHKCIYGNIIGSPLPVRYLKEKRLSHFPYHSEDFNRLRPDINKRINGVRPIHLYWIKEMKRNRSNISCMLERLFWILQYFFVYYGNTNLIYNYNLSTEDNTCVEYFKLSSQIANYLYEELKISLSDYSKILSLITESSMDLQLLSRIIVDVLDAQCNIYKKNVNSPKTNHSTRNIVSYLPQEKQKEIFEQNIACHPAKTLGRYHILQQYATTNYLACIELGQLYFYGEQLIDDENFTNLFNYICDYQHNVIIKTDFEEALRYFISAYHMTNPPSPIACWWIGQLYMNGLSSDGFAINEAEKYFLQAENYPPAYDGLGQIYISKAQKSYGQYLKNQSSKSYEQALVLFASALKQFDKAATHNWFYGYHNMAHFLYEHSVYPELIEKLSQELCLSVPINYEAIALTALSKYRAPQSLTELALYYMDNNRLKEAETLLIEASRMNHAPACYLHTMHFSSGQSQIITLKRLSEKNYLSATYSLADIYYESGDYDLALQYINRAENQICIQRKLDVNVTLNIFNLKQLITFAKKE